MADEPVVPCKRAAIKSRQKLIEQMRAVSRRLAEEVARVRTINQAARKSYTELIITPAAA